MWIIGERVVQIAAVFTSIFGCIVTRAVAAETGRIAYTGVIVHGVVKIVARIGNWRVQVITTV
jgi:hypothetical protein